MKWSTQVECIKYFDRLSYQTPRKGSNRQFFEMAYEVISKADFLCSTCGIVTKPYPSGLYPLGLNRLIPIDNNYANPENTFKVCCIFCAASENLLAAIESRIYSFTVCKEFKQSELNQLMWGLMLKKADRKNQRSMKVYDAIRNRRSLIQSMMPTITNVDDSMGEDDKICSFFRNICFLEKPDSPNAILLLNQIRTIPSFDMLTNEIAFLSASTVENIDKRLQ